MPLAPAPLTATSSLPGPRTPSILHDPPIRRAAEAQQAQADPKIYAHDAAEELQAQEDVRGAQPLPLTGLPEPQVCTWPSAPHECDVAIIPIDL